MKQKLCLWQLFSFAFTCLFGTLLHFLFDFTGGSALAAPISAVNESTFEHMKLLFFPLFAFSCIEWFFFRDRRDFWAVKLRGVLLGLSLIPVLFYTYNGVIGASPDFVNIAIFFLSAAMVYLKEARLFLGEKTRYPSNKTAFLLHLAFAALFILFTFYPPKLALFLDPMTGGYGIPL